MENSFFAPLQYTIWKLAKKVRRVLAQMKKLTEAQEELSDLGEKFERTPQEIILNPRP